MRIDASTIHAKVVIRLEGPRSSNQPHGRLSVVRWITCTFEPYQKPSRERRNTPKGMSFAFITRSMHDIKSVSWASLKKGNCWRSFRLLTSGNITEKMRPGTAARCSTRRQLTRWEWKKASCCTLLKRITRLKIAISEIKSLLRSPA